MSDTPIADALKANALVFKAEATPREQAASAVYTHRSEGWSLSIAAEYGRRMGERPQWKASAEGTIRWVP